MNKHSAQSDSSDSAGVERKVSNKFAQPLTFLPTSLKIVEVRIVIFVFVFLDIVLLITLRSFLVTFGRFVPFLSVLSV